MVKNKNNKSFWIGSPIGKNQPHNFFKTNPKNIPSYMFRDNDKDGVANVFDCKPNNPYDQGIIDAIINAGKAVFTKGESVAGGWKRGMTSESNPYKRFKQRRESRREQQVQTKRQLYEVLEKAGAPKSIESVRSTIGHRAAKEYAKSVERHQLYAMNVRREKEGLRPVTEGELKKAQNPEIMAAKVKQQAKIARLGDESHIASPFMAYGLPVGKTGKKAFEYAYKRFYQGKVPIYGKDKEGKRIIIGHTKSNVIEKARQTAQRGSYSPVQRHAIGAMKKTVQSLYPAIPRSATTVSYGVQSKKDRMSGRGRPKGSVKYSIQGRPVGVFEWRRWQSAQRQAFRQQLRQQQEMMKIARIQARMPQYEQVQPQTQQLPQEMQGQGVTPEYSQYQQVQQEQPQQVQYQYQPPQMPQEEQRRPIATVFKSSGGSPYPPVEERPLASARETINQGYVETVDSFTGRRFIKQLPRKENWM